MHVNFFDLAYLCLIIEINNNSYVKLTKLITNNKLWVEMNIIVLLIAAVCCVGNLHSQERELAELISIQNKSAVQRLETQETTTAVNESAGLMLQQEARAGVQCQRVKASMTTYIVQQVYYGGYNFHIADYPDGTRVVTCLDGDMKGVQGIAENGMQMGGSSNVQWHKGYFVHFYPAGTITSYPNMQVADLQ